MTTTTTVTAMERNETAYPKGDKIKRYKWELKDGPGDFMWIPKDQLVVDHSYQRPPQLAKVKLYAQTWAWWACSAIVVANRPNDPNNYVVDGQNRALAALKRSDISVLPCIVFESTGAVQEAAAFYDINANRRTPTTLDKWKAQLMRGDPHVVATDRLIRDMGRVPSKSRSPNSVSCVTVLLNAMTADAARVRRVYPLLSAVCEGNPMHERLVGGFLWLEAHMPEGQSLTDKRWSNRAKRIGYTALLVGANRAAALYAQGSNRVCAIGIQETLNKGLQHPLVLREDSTA